MERTRIGSPWVIAAMARLSGDRVVGWEANGGFLTGSPLPLPGGALAPRPTRDAVLPIVTTLWMAKREGVPLSALFDRLPQRFSGAGLLDEVPRAQSMALLARIRPSDSTVKSVELGDTPRWQDAAGESHSMGDGLAAELEGVCATLETQFGPDFGPVVGINFLDGVRVRFSSGDVAHIRPSGNAPQLRIYATADTPSRVREILTLGLAEPNGVLRRLLAL